jgi:hypothetical protein
MTGFVADAVTGMVEGLLATRRQSTFEIGSAMKAARPEGFQDGS